MQGGYPSILRGCLRERYLAEDCGQIVTSFSPIPVRVFRHGAGDHATLMMPAIQIIEICPPPHRDKPHTAGINHDSLPAGKGLGWDNGVIVRLSKVPPTSVSGYLHMKKASICVECNSVFRPGLV